MFSCGPYLTSTFRSGGCRRLPERSDCFLPEESIFTFRTVRLGLIMQSLLRVLVSAQDSYRTLRSIPRLEMEVNKVRYLTHSFDNAAI